MKPFVSIIIPCRNESHFILQCLSSVLANDYPEDQLEILVIDGMSDDGTREILQNISQKNPVVKMIDNPGRVIPKALNIGITAARGDILIRMDAHTSYAPNYIERCVHHLTTTGAAIVGGIWKTKSPKLSGMASAITQVLSSSFGVGSSHYRIGTTEAREVDTVAFFCCRKSLFNEVGLFNENMLRSEDMELLSRVKDAGGKVLMMPDIISYYHPRSQTIPGFLKHACRNGYWAIYPLRFVESIPVSLRHLIPFFSVAGFVLLAGLSAVSLLFAKILLGLVVVYGGMALAYSIKIAAKTRTVQGLYSFFLFPAFHSAYGLGSLAAFGHILCFMEFWQLQFARVNFAKKELLSPEAANPDEDAGPVSARKIVTNTIGLSTALVLRKVLSLFYFILIVRKTDTDITGLYVLLVSVATFFASFMDAGLPPVLIREGSKNPAELKRYFDNVMGLKTILSALALVGGIAVIEILDYPTLTTNLLYIVLATMIIESYAFAFVATLRSRHQTRFEAQGILIAQTLAIAIGSAALLTPWSNREIPLYFLVLANLANQIFLFIYTAAKMKKSLGLKPSFKLEKNCIRTLIQNSIPFLIIASFEKILFLDTIVLSQFTNETVIALLGPPLTIIGAFQFIPLAVDATIYPALSAFRTYSPDKFKKVFERSFTALMLLIIPSAAGLCLLSAEVLQFGFGGDYLTALPALQILAVSMIFIFATAPISSLLNSCHQQVKNTILLGVTLTIHLVLAVLLMPQYRVTGIALSSLASQIFLFFSALYFARDLLSGMFRVCLINVGKIMVASVPMALAVYFLKNHIHFLLTIPIGGLIYLVVARGFNLFHGFQIREILPYWNKKNSVKLHVS